MEASSREILYAKLNGETARLHWRELERHFARGAVIKVEPGIDLVGVAAQLAIDDGTATVAQLEVGLIARASAEDAIVWNARQAVFWAVVVAPWVLVQEISQPISD